MTANELKAFKAAAAKTVISTRPVPEKPVAPVPERAPRASSEALAPFAWAEYFAPLLKADCGLSVWQKRGGGETPTEFRLAFTGLPMRLLKAEVTGNADFVIADYHGGGKQDASLPKTERFQGRPADGETPLNFLRRAITGHKLTKAGVFTAYNRMAPPDGSKALKLFHYLLGWSTVPPCNGPAVTGGKPRKA